MEYNLIVVEIIHSPKMWHQRIHDINKVSGLHPLDHLGVCIVLNMQDVSFFFLNHRTEEDCLFPMVYSLCAKIY